ncbi:hypothetical protein B9Z55_021181 [Caenorhabditis nigoni]|uniref:SPK domain-containing protein n=1 Tax=Caenorhabditis nigoni TaxID=1611254 RepID=A0A2G5TQV0_9PELO|nr:hypothetical protein B9Z55_021181 [Caenorhabditis nigoni]
MAPDTLDVIRYISDRIDNYDKPESLVAWCKKAMKEYSPRSLTCMRCSVRNRLNRIERLDGYSLMEKLQLVFIFSRPVRDGFVQLLKDAKFKIKQDEQKRISWFSTEDGNIVRFSDHHPAVKYFQGVLCLNNSLQKAANKDRMKREKEQGQQDVGFDNTGSAVPLIEEQPIEDIPIEQELEHELDEDRIVGGYVGQGAFNGHINYEELDAQEFFYPGFSPTPESAPPVRVQKRRQSSTTDSGKRVKTEEMVSEATSSEYVATSSNQKASVQPHPLGGTIATTTPDEPKINVISLVTHIETIAMYFDLENLQKKASLAIGKMRGSGENKTLSVKKFNSLIAALLICIEENRIRRNETSIPLKSILKHLQLYLIRPLGSEEALESISQKIKEFVNEDDGVPPNLISESLAHFLMAVGFYNQLE